jgi:hypothetical protein
MYIHYEDWQESPVSSSTHRRSSRAPRSYCSGVTQKPAVLASCNLDSHLLLLIKTAYNVVQYKKESKDAVLFAIKVWTMVTSIWRACPRQLPTYY